MNPIATRNERTSQHTYILSCKLYHRHVECFKAQELVCNVEITTYFTFSGDLNYGHLQKCFNSQQRRHLHLHVLYIEQATYNKGFSERHFKSKT